MVRFARPLTLFLLALTVCAQETPVVAPPPPPQEGPKVGQPIPDLAATNEAGETVRLASFKGRRVGLFFFPKSFTPGCTAESCGFRDEHARYIEKGVVVLGASRDTPEELKKFKEQYNLPYSLLSDQRGELARALGVTPGARQTVIIGPAGVLERVITQVTAKTHPEDLLAELQKAATK